ncbi:MAG: DUF4406 domain-containing protein [Oscillospiraceae bacterium]
MFKNSEGYSDPTAGAAMSRIMKEYKQAQRNTWRRQNEIKSRPKVYVVSKYAGDTKTNVSKTIQYCRFVIGKKCIPVASQLIYAAVLQDAVAAERELGTMFGLALLALCDEIWVFGKERSPGMAAEIAEAKRLNKPLHYYTEEV